MVYKKKLSLLKKKKDTIYKEFFKCLKSRNKNFGNTYITPFHSYTKLPSKMLNENKDLNKESNIYSDHELEEWIL